MQELNDHELIIFAHYRYAEFMEGSKRIIAEELAGRGLTVEQVLSVQPIKQDTDDQHMHCKRCGASRFRSVDETKLVVRAGFGEEKTNKVDVCRLCGFEHRG